MEEKSTGIRYVFKEIYHPGKWCRTHARRGESQAVSLPDSSKFFLKIRGFLTAHSSSSLEKWHLVEPAKLKGCSDDYIVGILSEYIPGAEDLYHYRKCKTLTKKKVRDIGIQIASGLTEMHERGSIHRDIKLDNILIDQNGKIKIIDFGFSRSIENGRANTLCGGVGYVAPEVYTRATHGVKADAWSFGVLLYALAFDIFPPFINMDDFNQTMEETVKFADTGITIEGLSKRMYPFLVNTELGRDGAFWALLNKLLCHEKKRITVSEALSEQFLTDSLFAEIPQSWIQTFQTSQCTCL